MKLTELKSQSADQLHQLLLQNKRAILNLRFQAAAKDVKDASQFKKLRRTVARIKTLLVQSKSCGGA